MASNEKPRKNTASSPVSRPKPSKDAALTRQFRKAVIEKLDAWVETVPQPDKPLVGAASGSIAPLSPRDIVKHVKKRTPTGEKLVANWADLVLKNIKDTPLS
jgi:hypothetical protein